MFTAWNIQATPTTKDIDLLGKLENSVEAMTAIMRDICNQTVETDGMSFDPDSVTCNPIIEDAVYKGIRGFIRATLERVVLCFNFYYIWLLSKQFDFNGPILVEAITKTFRIRRTEIMSFLVPVSLAIVGQESFQKKWKAPGPWK